MCDATGRAASWYHDLAHPGLVIWRGGGGLARERRATRRTSSPRHEVARIGTIGVACARGELGRARAMPSPEDRLIRRGAPRRVQRIAHGE